MTNNIKRGAIVALLLSAIAAPTAAYGQVAGHGRTEGVVFSVRGGAYGVGYEGDREGGGGAVGVRVGFGLSSRVTVYAGVDGASVSEGDGFEDLPAGDDYTAYFLDLGARIHFRADRLMMPFLEVGASGLGLSFHNEDDQKTAYSGPSAHLGGGILYFVTPRIALETGASFTIGELQEKEVAGVAEDAGIRLAGMRIQVGASFYPFG